MPKIPWKETPVVSYPVLGGMDTTSAPAQVAQTSFRVADNVTFTDSRTMRKRGGLVAHSSTSLPASPVRMFLDYWKAGSSAAPSQKHVVACGASVFKDDGDGVWDDIAGTISIKSSGQVTSAIIGDVAIICSEGTIPYRWDQTGNLTALGGTPPMGSVVSEHLNRCWMNNINDPHRLYWTGPTAVGGATPTFWSIANGGGSMFIEEDDGDPTGITSLFKAGGALYVGKLTKLYRLEGRNNNTFRPVLVSDAVGVLSHNAVEVVGTDVLFPSLRGVESLAILAQGAQQGNQPPPSALIQYTYQNEVDMSKMKLAHSVYFPLINSVLFSLPLYGDTSRTICFCLSLATNAWTRFINFKSYGIGKKYNSTTKQYDLFTGSDCGMVYKYAIDTKSDYGVEAIASTLTTGQIYLGPHFNNVHNFKFLNVLIIPRGDDTIAFSYRLDIPTDSSGDLIVVNSTHSQQTQSGVVTPLGPSFILSQSAYGISGFPSVLQLPLKGNGRAIEWTLSNNVAGDDLEVVAWSLELHPSSQDRGA